MKIAISVAFSGANGWIFVRYTMVRNMLVVAVAAIALAGCTTTERDVGVGATAGAVVGGLADGGRGALLGAGAGALGGLLVRNLRNGYCEYRGRDGRIYRARCRK